MKDRKSSKEKSKWDRAKEMATPTPTPPLACDRCDGDRRPMIHFPFDPFYNVIDPVPLDENFQVHTWIFLYISIKLLLDGRHSVRKIDATGTVRKWSHQ